MANNRVENRIAPLHTSHYAAPRYGYGRARGFRLATLLIIASLLVGGCGFDDFFRSEPEFPLELDFARVLPAGWRPISQWHEVNIDGDNDIEYLLLFTYDSGQVGAVIYDQQIATDLVGVAENGQDETGVFTAPLQSFGYYRPYRLLPSNWDFTYGGQVSHGFVARPADANNIMVRQMARGGLAASAEVHPSQELVILGGTTHLTFVWWKNRLEGYGVTQLYAPSGFRGLDWQAWQEAPYPIDSIAGLVPLVDYRARSLLCRETAFMRRGIDETGGPVEANNEGANNAGANSPLPNNPAPNNNVPNNDDTAATPEAREDPSASGTREIVFDQQDLGINFCTATIPAHPFYPEGVALAYLLQAGATSGLFGNNLGNPARESLVTPGVSLGMIDGEIEPARLATEKVNDIEAYATVPVSLDGVQNGTFSPTTGVCVELAEIENPARRRWLLFTLRYQPPDMEARTPDQWTLSGVSNQPAAPIAGAMGYCRAILGLE